MKKILEFNLQKDVEIYTHHSIPLSILSVDTKYKPWLHEHFVQIFCYVDAYDVYRIDYTEHFKHYREVMNISEISLEKGSSIDDIVEFSIRAIDKDIYVSLHVDEFYLQSKGVYNQFHYVRQLLLHGYDKENRIFHAVGYRKFVDNSFNESGYDKFDNETITFDDLTLSFKDAKNYFEGAKHQYILLLGRNSEKAEYNFNKEMFIRRLGNYLNSKGFNEIQLSMGFSLYHDLIETLRGIIDGAQTRIDSRAFFILNEHKKLLYHSFKYLIENFNINDCELSSKIEEFNEKSVKRFQVLFYQFLKYEYKKITNKRRDENGNLIHNETLQPETPENTEYLKKLIRNIDTYSSTEKILLESIYQIFQIHLINN
jgi:hypothetical protein